MSGIQLDESTIQITSAVAVPTKGGRCKLQQAKLTIDDLPAKIRKQLGDAIIAHAEKEAASDGS